ncbi:MAG: hypothetical protein IKA88_05105 [Clostridia bacterium]|nr:hypothetical protein [Clostridia bacterium]
MQTLLQNTQAYTLLETEAKKAALGHAYLLLLNDPRNLREALKTFAKLLLIDENSKDAERITRLIDKESFSDCLFFPDPDKKLTVEDAERIREESAFSPVEGEKKLFVIGDFAQANAQTQNKLLKLLEEPPKGVIFLLGATTVFPILSTVLSRTKKLEIQPFDVKDVQACLARIYGTAYDQNTLELCAATSGGIVGEAQNVLEGGYYKTLSENAFALALCAENRLPTVVRQIGESRRQKELLTLLRLIFRDALLLKTQPRAAKSLLLQSEKANVLAVSKQYSASALLFAQEALSEAEKQVTFNAVFPQCIELCMAKLRAKAKLE